MEYIISILTMIGTSIVLYFAYIRPLKEEKKSLKIAYEITYNSYREFLDMAEKYMIENIGLLAEIQDLEKRDRKIRKSTMFKVTKKRGRPRKENK
jgi:hypothetical protein